ncbi:MAG TPA: toll/interleukin-1 receptor domain-containing protein, partial [Ktedonobacteraceae bacterium]
MIRPSNTPANLAFSAPLYLWDTPTIPTLPAISEKPAHQSVHIFVSYARQDQSLCDQLANHLCNLEYRGLITTWTAREIEAGEEIAQYIDTHPGTSYIILLLISADFLASEDCYSREIMQAIQYHEREEATVIPVLLRPVSFKDALFASLPSLPTNREPVVNWRNCESAFVDIALGIEHIIQGHPVSPLSQAIGSCTSPEIIIKSYQSSSLALSQPRRTRSRKRRGLVLLGLSLLMLLSAGIVLVLNPYLIPFAEVQVGSLTPFVGGLIESLAPFVGVLIGSLMVLIGVLLLVRVLVQRARSRVARKQWQEAFHYRVLEETWWQAEEEARQAHEEAQWQEQERAYYEKALIAYERALRQNSTDAVAYQGKGNVLVGLECYDEALMVF